MGMQQTHGRSSPNLNILATAISALLLALPATWAQPVYNSNDLTPPSSNNAKLTGAANSKQVGGSGNGHAMLLNGNALTSIDLHPVNAYSSMATATDDNEQCGWVSGLNGIHATKWSGSSSSAVDLHSAYNSSRCTGIHNGQQVGYVETLIYAVAIQRAVLWTGTPAYVDLGPIGFAYSKGLGVRNGQQVGYASIVPYPMSDTVGYQAASHAFLWTGTAASAVDLNPVGYDASQAIATNGTQQGGWAYTALPTPHNHAMLWSATAASAVDMHPAAYSDSRITSMTDTNQVGDGWIGPMGMPGSVRHALVWSGTPESVVDLNQYLPAGYTHAVATGVDANGNVVGFAYNKFVYGVDIPADAIAVIFAPGAASSTALSAFTVTPANAAPGAVLQATASIPTPAPAGGVIISFVSTNAILLPTPAPVTIAAGQTSASFTMNAGGNALQFPTSAKLYATDGAVSRYGLVMVTPVVNLSSMNINPVEGGFSTTGTINLSIPAQAGGATIALSSGDPTKAVVPASITLPLSATTASFTVTTTSAATSTTVPVTATFNGQTMTTSVTLSPAPVVGVSAVTFSFPSAVGGQSIGGTVSVNNFPRDPNGIVVTLTSSNPATLQVPATVTIPYGVFSVAFTATTTVVTGTKGVSVKAAYNTSNITTTIQVTPPPTVTIVKADYYTDTHLFKVQANTTGNGAVLTFGTDPNQPAIGTMVLELGTYNGALVLPAAPAFATVWNSLGGQATMAVTQRLTLAGGSGGGGGGTATSPKLTVSKSSKGNVISNPAGISCGSAGAGCSLTYASGTVVTLTATPDAGAIFGGWNGACVGTSNTCTLTMTADKSVSPVFR